MSYTFAEAAAACGVNKSTVLCAVKSGPHQWHKRLSRGLARRGGRVAQGISARCGRGEH